MKKKIIAIIVLSIMFIGGFIWYVIDESPFISKTVKKQVPDQMMAYNGNVIKEEKNGKLVWEVTAEKMNVNIETQAVSMKNMKGTFYREDGIITDLAAEEATYNQEKNLITMKGSIQVNETDGSSMKADAARYDFKQKRLYCEGNVEVNKDGYLVTGDRLAADQVTGNVRVDGNAHAVQIGE